MNSIDVSVILPIHNIDDATKPMLLNAIKSVMTQKVKPKELVIVRPTDKEEIDLFIKSEINDFTGVDLSIIENNGFSDFPTQTNLGVKNAKYDWVSILELDDEFSAIWFKNVKEYIKAYPDVDVFLPIIVDVNIENQFIGLTNEPVWAYQFSDEFGVFDINSLLAYQNFNIGGMVIKRDVYLESGGIKANMKLTFVYEFLLRLVFMSHKVMTLPKFGYKHMNSRPESLFNHYRETITPKEAKFWLEKAKSEYFYVNDRKIIYDENEN